MSHLFGQSLSNVQHFNTSPRKETRMNHTHRRSTTFALVVLLFATLCLWCTPPKAEAQHFVIPQANDSTRFFAMGSQAWGGTNSWTVIPSQGGKQAVVRFLEALTDLGPGRIVICSNGPIVLAQAPLNQGTNIQVSSSGTNGLTPLDMIVIEGYSGTTRIVQLAQVHAATTTNVSTRQGITNLAAGAFFYKVSTNQVLTQITNGATSLRAGQFVTVGGIGQPLAILIQGTTTAPSLQVGGTYE